MGKNTNDDSRSIANGSGFLFQLQVEQEIEETFEDHGWDIFFREYAWADREVGEDGFIDLILKKKSYRIIIECKRRREAKWLFVVPEEAQREQIEARCQVAFFSPLNQKPSARWRECVVKPASPEAEFCMIRGVEEGQATLEKWAGSLLIALESFATEELRVTENHVEHIYLPFIVTTAQLEVYYFNSRDISLEKGIMQTGEFIPQPFVRFRKSLTTKLSPNFNYSSHSMRLASKDKERTVFVVQASALVGVLQDLYIDSD
jgi:hypothetical protein